MICKNWYSIPRTLSDEGAHRAYTSSVTPPDQGAEDRGDAQAIHASEDRGDTGALCHGRCTAHPKSPSGQEMAAIPIGGRQRGDDKARIGFTFRPLCLANDASLAAPAFAGRPSKLLEPACRLPGHPALVAGLDQFRRDRAGEPDVLRQSEEEVDVAGLTPRHQRLAVAGHPTDRAFSFAHTECS
jgi:hypothetical protein